MASFEKILKKLQMHEKKEEKLKILLLEKKVQDFLSNNLIINILVKKLSIEERFVIFSLIILDQEKNLNIKDIKDPFSLLKKLSEDLIKVDNFYESIGGIIGYHSAFLRLLEEKNQTITSEKISFYEPSYIDIKKNTKEVETFTYTGLKNLHQLSLICPMGGSGDRLNLFDIKTKEPLPTAKLPFLGRTLLEGLIRDIEGLEYLYYKTYKKTTLTPLVIMTSEAKNNHKHILNICEENKWFKRPKESFFFIKQISVPMITDKGDWVFDFPLKLSIKPGGHGVIWKLMEDEKIFDALSYQKRNYALIRQINNPVASQDFGLLALIGFGIQKKKAFGFAACPRKTGSAEGVDILRQVKTNKGYLFNISSIEYVDFKKWNIEDKSEKNSVYSKFPSNTNILFANLNEIRKVAKKNPLPGMIINLKSRALVSDNNDKSYEIPCGRIELMMQNISDSLTDFKTKKISKQQQAKLKTFLTYNERLKTISVTKKAFVQNKPTLETPKGCFFDLLQNYHILLQNYCKMKLPILKEPKNFECPSFIFFMHPALGPLYSIIAKKIIGGSLYKNSEMQLEIADLCLENITLNGSLLIFSDLKEDSNKYLKSKAVLKNVKIFNKGINQKSNNVYWQNKIKRDESLKIILNKNSQFYAENINFMGDFLIEVPNNCKMIAFQEKNKINYKTEKLIL
jgi:UTP---glucose-1-phosphate uridylyltransferase